MEQYIIAIDQSTSSSKVFLMDASGRIIKQVSKPHQQFYPKPGYAEHDAGEIWKNVKQGIAELASSLPEGSLAGIGISNQRETAAIWDRKTGEPVYPAIVWQDVRAEALCKTLESNADFVRKTTGIPLSPYYSAAKLSHALQNDTSHMKRAQAGELCLGTIDSYLLYRLTNGASFATDVSNASRTQLMNLSSLCWDDELCAMFQIPKRALAKKILSSDSVFGKTACEGLPSGVPICGMMGDSHAALFAQGCYAPGQVKATYGTGSSVMMNVGEKPVLTNGSLSSSVGFGFRGKTHYVLEGNVTCGGDTLVWLKEEVSLIKEISEVEEIARSVESTEGVCLVPAFSGLGAPYFDGDARAVLCGMNRGTNRAHIVRAALESIALQDADVLYAMKDASGIDISVLRADGGPARNALLMQMQADYFGCTVRCSTVSELSALGAGLMAGCTAGVYQSPEAVLEAISAGAVYTPEFTEDERAGKRAEWLNAVARARN